MSSRRGKYRKPQCTVPGIMVSQRMPIPYQIDTALSGAVAGPSTFSLNAPEPGVDEVLAEILQDQSETSSVDDDYNEICFGLLSGTVVGLRYYSGMVNKREMVQLQREPTNVYDYNAIKVMNVLGEQVGHIKREMASVLSPVIDKGMCRLEGIIPNGNAKNFYCVKINLYLFGKPTQENATIDYLKKRGYYVQSHFSEESTNNKNNDIPYYDPKNCLSSLEVTRKLGKLFEEVDKVQKQEMEPVAAVLTKLYPHQKQALHWMVMREEDTGLPPFWTESDGVYHNQVTRFSTRDRPNPVKGGILADDMGLGKTLVMISLIVTHFSAETPIAIITPRSRKVPSDMDYEKEEMTVSLDEVMTKRADPDFKVESTNNTEVITISDEREALPEVTVQRRSKREVKKVKYSEFLTEDDNTEEGSKPKKSHHSKVCVCGKKETKQMIKCSNTDCAVKTFHFKCVGLTSKSAKKLTAWFCSECTENEVVDVPELGCTLEDQYEIPVVDLDPCMQNSKIGPALHQLGDFDFDGRISSDGPRTTLIVCPLSVLSNWEMQLDEHIHPNVHLKIYVFHGSSRATNSKFLSEQDIVITTYGTLASEYSAKAKKALFKLKWLRVVLDEGHNIRNPKTKIANAICSLETERKWVLTGTPIQNSMKDLWSLVNFLKISPFEDRQWWSRCIERPLAKGDKLALKNIQRLICTIALRRTKDQKVKGKLLVELPKKNIYIHEIEMNHEERARYNSIEEEGQRLLARYRNSGTLLHNYGQMLCILMRLRQICCHPILFKGSSSQLNSGALVDGLLPDDVRQSLVQSLLLVLSSGSDEECAICLDSLHCPVITPCAHVYCRNCISGVINTLGLGQKAPCPLCRGQISLSELVEPPPPAGELQGKVEENTWCSSSKVDALMEALVRLRQKDPSVKSIVVSQFTSFLDLLEIPLKRNSFQFLRLDGTMPPEKRAESLRCFQQPGPDSSTIFLLSLKAGGEGINLTAANHVFLMEPAWNPAAEDQCVDRCHRLGQTKPVTVVKFLVKQSVEQQMLKMQKDKRKLMEDSFGKKPTAEERRNQRLQDLSNLFNADN